jgi:hypothetical protein
MVGRLRRVLIGVLLLGVIVSACLVGLSVRSRLASASGGTYANVIVPNLTLTTAQSAAILDGNSAVAIAKTKLSAGLFTHPFTVQYGAFDESGLVLRTGGVGSAPQRLGMRDVWKITITGLHIGRPCGGFTSAGPNCPPPVSTLVVFVDDKLGQVLESQGY